MNLSAAQPVDLHFPSTLYTLQDTEEGTRPSLVYAPGELEDMALFGEMQLLQDNIDPSWALQDFGYTLGNHQVYPNGRMEGALQPPEYYDLSPPRMDTWEDGLKALEDFDWSVAPDLDGVEVTNEGRTISPENDQAHAVNTQTNDAHFTDPIVETQVPSPKAHQVQADVTAQAEMEALTTDTPFATFARCTKPKIPGDVEQTGTTEIEHALKTLEELKLVENETQHLSEGSWPTEELFSEPTVGLAQDPDVAMVDVATIDQIFQPGTTTRALEPMLPEGLFLHGLEPHAADGASSHSSNSIISARHEPPEPEAEAEQYVDVPMLDVKTMDKSLRAGNATPASDAGPWEDLTMYESNTTPHSSERIEKPEFAQEPETKGQTEVQKIEEVKTVDVDGEPSLVPPAATTPTSTSMTREDVPMVGPILPHLEEATGVSSEFMAPTNIDRTEDTDTDVGYDDQHFPPLEAASHAAEVDVTLSPAMVEEVEVSLTEPTLTNLPQSVLDSDYDASLDFTMPQAQAATEEQIQESFDSLINTQSLKSQLQEATANDAADGLADLCLPGYHGTRKMSRDSFEPTQSHKSERVLPSLENSFGSPSFQENPPAEEHVQEGAGLKRAKPTKIESSSDNEADAPAKKRHKNANAHTVTNEEDQDPNAHKDIDSKLPAAKPRRRSAKKSAEETGKPKPAEIYFEEETRPSDNRSTELNREDEATEEPMNAYDEDMQEHHTDAEETPTPTVPAPSRQREKNKVSNRELEALGSTLTPGMHLGLQYQSSHALSRPRTRTATPTFKKPMPDKMMMLDVDGPSEQESVSTVSKRRKTTAASRNKTSAPNPMATSRAEATPQPRTGRSQRSKAQLNAVTNGEDDQDLFPAPIFDTSSATAAAASPLVHIKIISQQTKSSKKATSNERNQLSLHDLGYGKRHTRGDTNYEESLSGSASATPSIIADDEADKAQPSSEQDANDDEDYSEPSTPIPQPKKGKKSSNLSLLKSATTSRAGTPTSSAAKGASSAPAKNIYGFSPRKTRSGTTATTPPAAGKRMMPVSSGSAPKSRRKVMGKAKNKQEDAEIETPAPKPRGRLRKTATIEEIDGNVKEKEPERRSLPRASTVAPESKAEPSTATTSKNNKASLTHKETSTPKEPERRSTRASTTAPDTAQAVPSTASKPTKPEPKAPERRSTRASTAAPQAVKTEPQEPERRSTGRSSAIELEVEAEKGKEKEKEVNIGRRLRSGD